MSFTRRPLYLLLHRRLAPKEYSCTPPHALGQLHLHLLAFFFLSQDKVYFSWGCCSKQYHKLFAGTDRPCVSDSHTVERLILTTDLGSEGHLPNKLSESADSNSRNHDKSSVPVMKETGWFTTYIPTCRWVVGNVWPAEPLITHNINTVMEQIRSDDTLRRVATSLVSELPWAKTFAHHCCKLQLSTKCAMF